MLYSKEFIVAKISRKPDKILHGVLRPWFKKITNKVILEING